MIFWFLWMGACDFLKRKLTSLGFSLVLLGLISLSDFYFQKVTRTLCGFVDFVEGGFLFRYFGAVLGLWMNPPYELDFYNCLGFL